MFCIGCAEVNPGGAERCRGCGRRLERAAPERGRGAVWLRRRVTPVLAVAPLLAVIAVGFGYQRAERAELAGWYERAAAAEAAGRYPEALAAYAAAEGYGDAGARRATLAAGFAPAEAAYRRAVAALGAGDHAAAIAELRPIVENLPAYEDGTGLLAEARQGLAEELRGEADAAVTRRDWLAAEAALAGLVAVDPGDGATAERLVALRREHAPLVFERDGALWLTGPDGADERLVTDAVRVLRPIWSPDRSRIAVVAGGTVGLSQPAALYVIAPDGSGLTELNDDVHPSAVPTWSPDGTRLAYTSVEAFDLRSDRGLLAVHVVDVASGVDRDVTGDPRRHAVSPTWAPTGDRIAFVSRPARTRSRQDIETEPGDLRLLDLATGEVESLAPGRLLGVSRAVWAPGGDRLLAYGRSPEAAVGMTIGGEWIDELTPNGGVPTRVDDEIDTNAGWAPAWAPDGARFAYVDGPRTVVVRERDGTARRIETEANLDGALSWSPDGGALLAVGADAGGPAVVIGFGAGGATQRELSIGAGEDGEAVVAQWGPVLPAADPAAVSVGGTGLDGREPGGVPGAAPTASSQG